MSSFIKDFFPPTWSPGHEVVIGDAFDVEETVPLVGHIGAALPRLVQEQQPLVTPCPSCSLVTRTKKTPPHPTYPLPLTGLLLIFAEESCLENDINNFNYILCYFCTARQNILSFPCCRSVRTAEEEEEEELVVVVCQAETSQCRVPARLLPLARCEGKEATGARICVKYTPDCSCQVSKLCQVYTLTVPAR